SFARSSVGPAWDAMGAAMISASASVARPRGRADMRDLSGSWALSSGSRETARIAFSDRSGARESWRTRARPAPAGPNEDERAGNQDERDDEPLDRVAEVHALLERRGDEPPRPGGNARARELAHDVAAEHVREPVLQRVEREIGRGPEQQA